MKNYTLTYGESYWAPYHNNGKDYRSNGLSFFARYTNYKDYDDFYDKVQKSERSKPYSAPYWERKEPSEYGKDSKYLKSLNRNKYNKELKEEK